MREFYLGNIIRLKEDNRLSMPLNISIMSFCVCYEDNFIDPKIILRKHLK